MFLTNRKTVPIEGELLEETVDSRVHPRVLAQLLLCQINNLPDAVKSVHIRLHTSQIYQKQHKTMHSPWRLQEHRNRTNDGRPDILWMLLIYQKHQLRFFFILRLLICNQHISIFIASIQSPTLLLYCACLFCHFC